MSGKIENEAENVCKSVENLHTKNDSMCEEFEQTIEQQSPNFREESSSTHVASSPLIANIITQNPEECKEETFQEVTVTQERELDVAAFADESFKETTDIKEMDNNDLSTIGERLQNLANTQLLEMQQHSKPNSSEEKKVVKRKIKIKVSVSAQDQERRKMKFQKLLKAQRIL